MGRLLSRMMLEKKKTYMLEGSGLPYAENIYAYASQYSKSYTLPPLCNTKKISASYKNGILTVGIPKGEEAKSQQIKII